MTAEPLVTAIPMSAGGRETNPTPSNFELIFKAALETHKKVTKKDIHTEQSIAQLDGCDSPHEVLNVFLNQAQAFEEIRKGDNRLVAWLEPTVHTLFILLDTIGKAVGLVSPAKYIVKGIGLLLLTAAKNVAAGHNTLLKIFESIQHFLKRLEIYNRIPPTTEMIESLGKIMAEVLSVLAISTKEMAESRMKKYTKALVGLGGKKNIDAALERLDKLTAEESRTVGAINLEVTHQVKSGVETIKAQTQDIQEHIHGFASDRSRNRFRTWLTPPDPSKNHNDACNIQRKGTAAATWFTEGTIFKEWKMNGSLLWIHGHPGSGKSILCSSIIKNIKQMQSILMSYYYFDFRDVSKHDLRGLLSSVLVQLCEQSDRCCDILLNLFNTCRHGLEKPDETALAQCLKDMIELPEQGPIYIIIDALDECPNNIGTPIHRKQMLDFLEDLVGEKYSNLHICVTSRPEQDIKTALSPLTSDSNVSLHEEDGQIEDITNYIRYFVDNDREMKKLTKEFKELIINELSKGADGMFRWVYCQLDTLSRCPPAGIRRALDELPATLDDTYKCALQRIPQERSQFAHRLFQCLIAAFRPLLVGEVAEILAIQFDEGVAPILEECCRLDDPEDAVLSVCSSLVTIVDDRGSRVVQFSHLSVKEYLESGRFPPLESGSISLYHITLEPAHTILAQACLAMLLWLDNNIDEEHLGKFPLAFYASQYFVDHARSGKVAQIEEIMKCLFDPKKPHQAARGWMDDADSESIRNLDERAGFCPFPPRTKRLYYAALCGFSELVDYRLTTHQEDINIVADYFTTALHDAYRGGDLDLMQQLLHHGADPDTRDVEGDTVCHLASEHGQTEVVKLLLQCGANVNAKGTDLRAPLHNAARKGHKKIARLLLEHGADVDARTMCGDTPLILASKYGHIKLVRLLLDCGADMYIKGDEDNTAAICAMMGGHKKIGDLLFNCHVQRSQKDLDID